MSQWLYDNPKYYDIFYDNKCYAKEAEYVIEIAKSQLEDKKYNILVIGCGTGRHSTYFRDRGHDVVAVDKRRSMLSEATNRSDASFLKAALPRLPLDCSFDIIFIPFGVLNYISPERLEQSIDEVAGMLAKNGILIFDLLRPIDESEITMQVCEEGGGTYCRLAKVTSPSPGQSRYEYFILLYEEEFSIHYHSEDVFAHSPNDIRELLSQRSFQVTSSTGYGSGGYLDEILTVFTAIR